MEFSQYWIMKMPMNWVDLELECRIEEAPNTQLVVFETRAEMDCLIKYLTDEYPDQAVAKYAIGLQEPDEYKGVYEWRSGGKQTPSFTNWANTAPSDKKCVTMEVGVGAIQNGKWTDVECTTGATFFGICERRDPIPNPTFPHHL